MNKKSIKARFSIKTRFVTYTLSFINFLKNSAKSHSVRVNYRTQNATEFTLFLSSEVESNVEEFLLELILKKGIYYFVCGLTTNPEKLVSEVVEPVFSALLNNTFDDVPQISYERLASGNLATFPSNASFQYTRDFNLLYSKYSLRILRDIDYVLNLDLLLNNFLLENTGHKIGERSANFSVNLNKVTETAFNFTEETETAFKLVHSWRTNDLHRRKSLYNKELLEKISKQIAHYFGYYDDYYWSQTYPTLILNGKEYEKVRMGSEVGDYPDWNECGDCAVRKGEYHVWACDWEQCPRCGNQLLGCGCKMS